jgi:hypothetical protein
MMRKMYSINRAVTPDISAHVESSTGTARVPPAPVKPASPLCNLAIPAAADPTMNLRVITIVGMDRAVIKKHHPFTLHELKKNSE